MSYTCPKCEGKGNIAAYRNVQGGVCFKCGGTGSVASKPASPSFNWACIYDGVWLFTKKAKTEKEALKKAVVHWKCNRHFPAFVDVHSEDQITVKQW